MMQTDHLGQEGLEFCLHCGGELAPSPFASFGLCFDCGTSWDRVFTHDCPECDVGWVHLHHPDHVERSAADGRPTSARGFGWCDACDTHVAYEWWYRGEAQIEPGLTLESMRGRAEGREYRYWVGGAVEMVQTWS